MVITTSGTIATFKTRTPKDIKSLKVYFGPIQEGSGEPSPTNVRPISGRTGLEVVACGRNLLDLSDYAEQTSNSKGITFNTLADGSVIVNGKSTDTNTGSIKNYVINKSNLPPGRYYCSTGQFVRSVNGHVYMYPYTWDNATSSRIKQWDGTTVMDFQPSGKYCEMLLPDEMKYDGKLRLIALRCYPGKTAENERFYPSIINSIENPDNISWEPYNARNLTVDWTSEAGTIYGGYVDLISGELVKTKYAINPLDCSIYLDSETDDAYNIYLSFDWQSANLKPIAHTAISNRFSRTVNPIQIGGLDNYNSIYLGLPKSELTTVDLDGARKWFEDNPTIIVYDLTVPIVYNLVGQQLNTLVGRNNIWGVDCDTIEVSYDFEDLLDMTKTRQKVLRACQIYKTKLPPGYIEYDWLEGVGSSNSRIDTGVPGNDTTLQIDCTFMPVALNNNSYYGVFGNYVNENDSYCWRIILQSNTSSNFNCGFYVTMGNNSPGGGGTEALYPTNNAAPMEGVKCNVIMAYGEATMYAARTHHVTRPFATKNENATHICIGGMRVTSTGGTAVFRYYNFKFSSQGKLIRDYRPCVRTKDNKAGFYDMVNYTFNPSIGSVDFVAGNDT